MSSFILKGEGVIRASSAAFRGDFSFFLAFVLNVAVFAENRITPPSPHCLRL